VVPVSLAGESVFFAANADVDSADFTDRRAPFFGSALVQFLWRRDDFNPDAFGRQHDGQGHEREHVIARVFNRFRRLIFCLNRWVTIYVA
jgi:hypothetical protein